DGFKQVNDRFGHLEGNRVLQAVADGLQRSCRQYDYVARMGGDEFVIILPGIGKDEIEAKLDQLDLAVRAAGRSVSSESVLGVSVGVAFSSEDGRDAEALLAAADRRMYKAKQSHKTQSGLEMLRFEPI